VKAKWHGQCELKDSERKEKFTERYIYAKKAPEFAWDLYVRMESDRSGWPLEVLVQRVVDSGTRGRYGRRDEGDATWKIRTPVEDQSQPWE
jgi:hypothetical protein